MIRATALVALVAAAPVAADDRLPGEWHCFQDGSGVRVEAQTVIGADGSFTAQMEYRIAGPSGRLTVRALYAARWRASGSEFWDHPLDARIVGITMDGTPTEAPEVAQAIRATLMEAPDGPLQITFEGADILLLSQGDGTGATFECLRREGASIGL